MVQTVLDKPVLVFTSIAVIRHLTSERKSLSTREVTCYERPAFFLKLFFFPIWHNCLLTNLQAHQLMCGK